MFSLNIVLRVLFAPVSCKPQLFGGTSSASIILMQLIFVQSPELGFNSVKSLEIRVATKSFGAGIC